MNKKSFEELFTSPEFSDYSVIVIHHLEAFDSVTSEETMTKNISASESLLEASFIPFHLEKNSNKILCYLNYDRSSFSIRTFVGSLRQVLYTIGMKVHSYVLYSEGITSREELQKELDFLLNCSYYGFLLGRRRPISGTFLHKCVQNTDSFELPKANMVTSMLRSHDFAELSDALTEYGTRFSNFADDANAVPLGNLFECISDFYYIMKFYLSDQNYSHVFFKSTLADSIIRYDGMAGIFNELAKVVLDYAGVFKGMGISEKKHKHIEEMLEYIDNNLATVSLAGLSAKFSLTPEYVCRLFKTEYAINFTEYLKKKRFEKAVEILQTDKNMTIADICDEIGLQSRSYFQNIFRKEYGVSPDVYRKEYFKAKR